MVPGEYNITIYRGGTFEIDFYASDKDGDISFGEIYDAAEMHIYDGWIKDTEVDLPTPLMSLSVADGTITIIGTVIRVHIPATITQAIDFINAQYRLRLIAASQSINPIVDPFMKGSVTVKN